MELNKNTLVSFALLLGIAAICRILGFAPQLAMALFAGAVIKDKKLAFAVPIFSMFISDVIYHLLYINGLTPISGFYEGQLTNYILFGAMTAIGFMMKRINVPNVIMFSLLVCTAFFLLSNFFVWNAGSGLGRPHNFAGLMMAYDDGLPFFKSSVYATLIFSGVLFGAWKLITGFKPLVNQ